MPESTEIYLEETDVGNDHPYDSWYYDDCSLGYYELFEPGEAVLKKKENQLEIYFGGGEERNVVDEHSSVPHYYSLCVNKIQIENRLRWNSFLEVL